MRSAKHKVVTIFVHLAVAGGLVWADQPTPDEALNRLQQGNQRFVSGDPKHPNTDAARRHETFTGGQHPFVTLMTCSDSRVPVELIFDQGIGDVFVIRVAGNVSNTDEIGSIEYGVGHLHTPLLVVLGHTRCGAVTAVVEKAELHGNIPPLVERIKLAAAKARRKHPKLDGEDFLHQAIRENVWQSIEDALANSAETRELVKEGKLRVVGAIYDLDSGSVEWMGRHPNESELLTAKNTPKHAHPKHPSDAR